MKTLDEAEALLPGNAPVARVRYLLERGRTFNSSKAPEKAKPLFQEAWDLARKEGLDFYAVDAAHMMGIVEAPDRAWNEKALEAAERSRDSKARKWLGALYNNMGWSALDKKDYEKLRKAVEYE
jgi:hypothetical protein